jgi:hypothetical protein
MLVCSLKGFGLKSMPLDLALGTNHLSGVVVWHWWEAASEDARLASLHPEIEHLLRIPYPAYSTCARLHSTTRRLFATNC